MTTSLTEVTSLDEVVIGQRVSRVAKAVMGYRGRSQADLAALLNLDKTQVSKRLRGLTAWKTSEVVAMSEWLRVSTDMLFSGQPPRLETDPPNGPSGSEVQQWDSWTSRYPALASAA